MSDVPGRSDVAAHWVVRLADPSESSILAAVHRDTAIAAYSGIFPAEAPPPSLDELMASWQHWFGPDIDRRNVVFVAEHAGVVLGVIRAGPDPTAPTAGHIARFYVRSDRWGNGIGTALYDRAVSHLRELRFAMATLWVLEHNWRARGWYERLGWKATGERKTVYAPAKIDDIRYSLEL